MLSAAFSVGLMEATVAETGRHLTSTRLEHLGSAIIDQPAPRSDYARMRLTYRHRPGALGRHPERDRIGPARRHPAGPRDQGGGGRGGARGNRPGHEGVRRGRVPQGDRHRAAVPRRPSGAGDGADNRCPARFHRSGHRRPRTLWEADVPGNRRAAHGRGRLRPQGRHHLGWFPPVVAGPRPEFDYVLYSNYERQVEDLVAGRIHAAWNSPLAWVRARRLAAAQGADGVGPGDAGHRSDLSSVVAVRVDSPIADARDLAGGVVATGAVDSPRRHCCPSTLCGRRASDPV